MTEFHFSVFAPNGGQIVNSSKLDFRCFFENSPGVVDLLVVLVELGEGDPQLVQLADGLQRIDGLKGLRKGIDTLSRFFLITKINKENSMFCAL